MTRRSVIGIVLAVAILSGATIRAEDPQPSAETTAVARQCIEVFTGDRVRLTHHDQSVTEGILVSMNRHSLTVADTLDVTDHRLVFFDSISTFEVARAGSTLTVKAYRVDRSWLTFSEISRADTTQQIEPSPNQ